MTVATTRVDDWELLYRAVRDTAFEYSISEGVLRVSLSAFNDRERRPSVDRSSLRFVPRDARVSSTDGVVSLETRDVRDLAQQLRFGAAGELAYGVDAIHRPIDASETIPDGNAAHCQIECEPEITSSHYKRLKEALARLASARGWVVVPSSDGGG